MCEGGRKLEVNFKNHLATGRLPGYGAVGRTSAEWLCTSNFPLVKGRNTTLGKCFFHFPSV